MLQQLVHLIQLAHVIHGVHASFLQRKTHDERLSNYYLKRNEYYLEMGHFFPGREVVKNNDGCQL